MKIKCLIIEDEIPAQKVLQNYLGKIPEVVLVETFQSALEANQMLTTNSIDLVFLDINLPDISGIQYIKTLVRPPKIIMTTAYSEFAAESFELDTIYDYLVKPFSFDRFLKAINKVKKQQRSPQKESKVISSDAPTLFLNVDKTLHRIVIANILYILSDRNYVTVVTKNKQLTYIDSLKNWSKKLENNSFIQVHRSYIVNPLEIEKISGNLLTIAGKQIPIGRLYKSSLLKKLAIP